MAKVGAEPYEFKFDPPHCALVIIDMQRDFAPGRDAKARRLGASPQACRVNGPYRDIV